jgi:beta-lactamase regulating signal transducer with metallopeptidase domain
MPNWIAAAVLETLLNGIIVGMALVAALWLLLRLLPGSTAATRYALWSAAMVAILSLPLPMLWAPASGGQASALPSAALLTLPTPGGWVLWALVAWLAISAALLARLAFSYRSLRRLKREARPLVIDQVLNETAGGRRVQLRASSQIAVPMAAGLFDPVILIPEALPEQLSEEEFRQVLLHELAHLRRRDDWTNLAQKVLEALFFFHPAVWCIARRLNLEREIACDDCVVAMTGAARPYAVCLTKMAQRSAFARAPQLAAGAVARKGQVSHRIESLLSRRGAGGGLSKIGVAVATGLLALVALFAANLAPVAVAEPAVARLSWKAKPIPVVAMAYAKPVVRALPPRRMARAEAPSVLIQECTYVIYSGEGVQVRSWVTILWVHPAPAPRSPGQT